MTVAWSFIEMIIGSGFEPAFGRRKKSKSTTNKGEFRERKAGLEEPKKIPVEIQAKILIRMKTFSSR